MEPASLIRPWVGNDYFSAPSPERVLLLGESMYTDKADDYPPETLIRLIRGTVSGEWRKRNNFYKRVYRLVSGNRWSESPAADRAAFWARVAFYNYVQRPVLGRPLDRPAGDMWAESAAYFRDVFDWLAPGAVVVLGKEVWEHLGAAGFVSREGEQAQVKTVAHGCPALMVRHPSWPRLTRDERT